MTVPAPPDSASTGSTGRSENALQPVELAVMAVMGGLLISGYVVLSALGRDTTGYVLFLGGPAMTSIVGTVLARRVKHVQAQVATVQVAAAVALDDEAHALHLHLAAQDQQLEHLAAAVGSPADAAQTPSPDAQSVKPATAAQRSGLPVQRAQDALSHLWPIVGSGRRRGD